MATYGDTGHKGVRHAEAGAWRAVLQGACALAAAMGVGRFVYTPILPLMHEQAGLSATLGGQVATANYVGYLIGAVAASLAPRLGRSVPVLRLSLVALIATLACMPLTTSAAAWIGLRTVAGAASALVFVVSANATVARLRAGFEHRTGWVYGGVGAGIAVSGLLVLVLGAVGTWSQTWWASAALAALLACGAWRLSPPGPADSPATAAGAASAAPPRMRIDGPFLTLLVSYVLEGAGYIIAGTFLVAAVAGTGPGWLGSSTWVLVGIAAVPSCAAWALLGRTRRRPPLLAVALVAQAAGIALPALLPGVAAAAVSAVVFGGTFMGITTLALATGAQRGVPRSAALLTAGYAAGQVLGPLAVAPLLGSGYRSALLVAAGLVLAAAVAVAPLCRRRPAEPPAPRPLPREQIRA